jgi:alkylation response protein AidB-like acyl-CoA dehydrogenase
MRFAPDPDAVAFADTVRAVLAKHGPPDLVGDGTVPRRGDGSPRIARESVTSIDRRAWQALADLGALAITTPEERGGLGLDERALVLVLEEVGRAALPFPFVETAAVAMPLIGDRIDPSSIVATDLGGPLVPWAAEADWLLVVGEGALHLVAGDVVAVEAVPSLDRSRRLGRVQWAETDATLVTDDPAAVAAAVERGVFATAAVLIGLAQQMLDLTVAYAQQRVQFGAPIGSFQAVKHRLANTALALTFARPAVHRAAVSLATNDPLSNRDVSMAKAMASSAAITVAGHALQCHGAIGYTTEHELHRLHTRATALARSWGTASYHRARVGEALGLPIS